MPPLTEACHQPACGVVMALRQQPDQSCSWLFQTWNLPQSDAPPSIRPGWPASELA